MIERLIIIGALIVQTLCAGFFIWEAFAALTGWRVTPISWQARELIEIGAAVGLVIGIALGTVALIRSRRRHLEAEAKLRLASAAFKDLVAERFEAWGLTPAERDVAMFSVKGLSMSEIAALRDTSEGTVKAQSNAIYRKAGVKSRAELLSLFIDRLMETED